MDAAQKTDAFVAKYNGVYIDEDKYYGSQCWDLVARYAREVWGCPYLPTGSGGAEGLYRLFQQPIPQFFDKVSASDLRKGDIAVTTAAFYQPYGHTFLVWEREGNTVWAFEQDGSKDPNGDGIADGVAYLVQRTITSKIAGGLRPKGANMSPSDTIVDDQIIALIVSLGEYREATAGDFGSHRGQPIANLLRTFINAPTHANQQFKIADYDNLKKQFEDYKKANPVGGGSGEYTPAGQLFFKKG